MRRRTARAVLAGLGVMLLLSGCTLGSGDGTGPSTGAPTGPAGTATATPVDPAGYDAQPVDWRACGRFECATVAAPLDWDRPDGAQRVSLALIRARATGRRRGSLLINPGGPGGSGVQLVRDSLDAVTTETLRRNYDIVGFDPRGVGSSSAVRCLDDRALDRFREQQFDGDTDAGLAAARQSWADFAAACGKATGPLLGHIDTPSAARDLDMLRAVLGERTLNYLGFSYGTSLGVAYAERFPDRVGRFVLDGAVDPELSNEDLTLGQARGFEAALAAYVADCQSGGRCPLTGGVEGGLGQVRALIDRARTSPLRTDDGRGLTADLAASGILTPLYNEANWPVLTSALAAALDGDGTQLLALADFSDDRDSSGHYRSNSFSAFTAVTCLDYPMDATTDGMRRDAAELRRASPTFGEVLAYGGVTCESWPDPPTGKPHAAVVHGAAPILVVGTTGDPATPYPWAQALTRQLGNATLLTYEGTGHTAYGRAGVCVDDAVDGFLVGGRMPGAGTRCR